jgi:hypothetical protein
VSALDIGCIFAITITVACIVRDYVADRRRINRLLAKSQQTREAAGLRWTDDGILVDENGEPWA